MLYFPFIPVILSWFVNDDVLKRAIGKHRYLIEERDVETMPENVSNAVLDQNVDIFLVRQYFTQDAWLLVEELLKIKSENVVWQCKVCSHDLHSAESIICD